MKRRMLNDINKNLRLRYQIGNRLKEFRLSIERGRNINTGEFSEKVDIQRNKLQFYEEGKLLPDSNDLLKLHLNFGLNINWLLSGKGDMILRTTLKKKGGYKISPYKGFPPKRRGEPCVHPEFSDNLLKRAPVSSCYSKLKKNQV